MAKILLIALGVLGLAYLAMPFALAWSAVSRQAELEAELTRLTRLAGHALVDMGPPGSLTVELGQACRNLEVGQPEGLLAYLAPLAAGRQAEIQRGWVQHAGHFFGFRGGNLHIEPHRAAPITKGLVDTWLGLLFDPPWEWFDYEERRVERVYPALSQVRYLAVGRLDGILLPALQQGSVFRPGLVSLRVQVLGTTSGQIACDGVLVGQLPEAGHYRAWAESQPAAELKGAEQRAGYLKVAFGEALDVFILHGLCERAEPALCEHARRRLQFER